jgi:Flp pilus assembly protein TadG
VKGLAALEFAIVAPMLALLLTTGAEFGSAMHRYAQVVHGVRAGARHLMRLPTETTTAVNLVLYAHPTAQTNVVVPGLTAGAISTTCPSSITSALPTGYAATCVTVTGLTFTPALVGFLGTFTFEPIQAVFTRKT